MTRRDKLTGPGCRRLPWRAVAALALGVLVAACSVRLNERPALNADLSGQWTLDQSLSQDPYALLKPRRHRARHGARHGPGAGVPAAGGEGGGHEQQSREDELLDEESDPTIIKDYFARPAKIVIEQLPTQLKVTADGSPSRYGFGDELMASVGKSLADRRTGWTGSAFVVSWKVSSGPDAIRSYQLANGGTQLVVTTKISGSRAANIEFRSVYGREQAR